MPEKGKLHTVMQLLDSNHAFKCKELGQLLETLGCRIKDCKSPGHKQVFHDGIEEFYSVSYNCGHGKNPEIKRSYIRNISRHLKPLRPQLLQYLDEEEQ